MAVTITAGAAVLSPQLVTGFESERESGNVVHDVIGRANPDVTLRPAKLRTGTIEALFLDEASSKAAEDALSAGVSCTLAADLPTASFSFVIPDGGRIRRSLDDTTRTRWLVAFDFQEITP